MFDIPVVLFLFRRIKAVEIVKRIAEVKPARLYLLSDQGRTDEEKAQVTACRKAVEEAIDWDCEIIRNYADENRGVYGNIGEGAKWVFQREENAIFLEDDNLPEVSFFQYCKDLLIRYADEPKILWICGTNYLGEYDNPDADYMFTRHLLPCGWASWSKKFLQFYDGELKNCSDSRNIKIAGKRYYNKMLFVQYRHQWLCEYSRIIKGVRPRSWDYQMDFTLKYNDLYGISPVKNQIRNIGVDEISEHGGVSYSNVMTDRFCSMPSYPLSSPLRHPKKLNICEDYEKKIAKILQFPLNSWIKLAISDAIKHLMHRPLDEPLRKQL